MYVQLAKPEPKIVPFSDLKLGDHFIWLCDYRDTADGAKFRLLTKTAWDRLLRFGEVTALPVVDPKLKVIPVDIVAVTIQPRLQETSP
jgi:hypothetical protein